ncbi:MAG: hypothetical protein OMM_04539 [Candidatus Magnetoglobus multicellularis str. Araruama]|uniref:HNH nuclease domain-containing protein n=1 Tax=Candidatus Magnetoglobus multicellularis str. Araruama TaxID=890399 RepID=A0A1V1P152_9BACT|nr:MAG: hypothetical protein OMM_04539 [Candidatus Magnetoglobus multicellularis str. Araruama]
MKAIDRLSPPDCLNNEIEDSRKNKISFYKNLWDKYGKVYPRWNSTCKDVDGISNIRKQLLKMSNSSCAYCGKKIGNSSLDVDHYLPLSQFPYIAYCWYNLIPACKACNQSSKRDFIPSSIKSKIIVEDIVANTIENKLLYNHKNLLTELHDRIIEPTFDNPEEHIQFNPEFYYYEPKTEIGKITINMFFNHKEVAEEWEKLSELIKELVQHNVSESLIIRIIDLYGYEYVGLKFYEYWLREKEEGRINR